MADSSQSNKRKAEDESSPLEEKKPKGSGAENKEHAHADEKGNGISSPTSICNGLSEETMQKVWFHYRSYMTSVEEAEEEGDDEGGISNCNPPNFDELHEVIEILLTNNAVEFNESMTITTMKDENPDFMASLTTACHDDNGSKLLSQVSSSIYTLLPVLMSQVYMHLGDDAISKGFDQEEEDQCEEDGDGYGHKNENENENGNGQKHQQQEQQRNQSQGFNSPEDYLQKSLRYFPMNAAALSMLANYRRMNLSATPDEICRMYELAATNARMVRDAAVSILESATGDDDDGEGKEEDEDDEGNFHKEWVELLLLDGIAGAEFVGEDEEDEGSCDGEEDQDVNEKGGRGNQHDDESNQETEEEFSSSGVESTASFMAALLHSTLQRHDNALEHLGNFDLSHRIHPNVWLAGTNPDMRKNVGAGSGSNDKMDLNGAYFEPKAFTGQNGFLPPKLYERLCQTFSPSAAFWKESDYQNRGYYSFFEDIAGHEGKDTPKPRHLIDDVVLNHLLPHAQSALPDQKIVGYEFWAHTRPLKANLGHQLHFDTDEALLAQEQQVTHPVVSSVLYLTGNKSRSRATAGATIVFNQTPDSKAVATKAWISQAHDNRYMIFSGNCLHGVLPCSGDSNDDSSAPENAERLTLMVGFWTRRVPDKMNNRHLYGPCGPIPEANQEHTWVSELLDGYNNETDGFSHSLSGDETTANTSIEALPSASPAWEDISEKVEAKKDTKLDIPSSLDHRFFVKSAPHCFTASLFKNETF